MIDNTNAIINDLENIAEILFNNGYNSWGNAIRKSIHLLKDNDIKVNAFPRILWERDLAIQQLAEIGKCLGEKMDDIVQLQKTDEYICEKCSRGLKQNWKWCPFCGQKTKSLFIWIKDPVRFVEGD